MGRGGETPTLYAQADLASVLGNLPLDVDTSRRHMGYLQWREVGLPEERRGGVAALIAYLPPEYEGLGGARGIPVGVPGVEYADFFIGQFPADD